jgi:hypothetical protein
MKTLQTHTINNSLIQITEHDGSHHLYVQEPSGKDAAAPISAEILRAMLGAIEPQTELTVPAGLGPISHSIAAHFVHGFEALKELAKSQPGEVDALLRHFVKTIENWRAHVLKEIAA